MLVQMSLGYQLAQKRSLIIIPLAVLKGVTIYYHSVQHYVLLYFIFIYRLLCIHWMKIICAVKSL